MTNFIVDHLLEDESYNSILKNIEGSQYIYGMSEESLPHFIYALWTHSEESVFLIVEDEVRARKLYESALGFPNIRLADFPRSNISFHNIKALESDGDTRRLRTLNKLVEEEKFITIASAEALIKKISTPTYFKEMALDIGFEDEIDTRDLEERLAILQYERVERVEGRGEFAIRGGIIDIYPIDYKNPVRIELFDTEIDSIRTFEVGTQRSVDEMDTIRIPPAREFLLTDRDKEDILGGLRADIDSIASKDYGDKDKEKLEGKYKKILDKVDQGLTLDNMDLVLPYVKNDSYANVLDYFQGILVFEDLDRVFQKLGDIEEKYQEDLAYQVEKAEGFISQQAGIFTERQIRSRVKDRPLINISQLKKKLKSQKPDLVHKLQSSEVVSYAKQFPKLVEELKARVKNSYQVVIFTGSEALGQRLEKNLSKEGIDSIYIDDPASQPSPGRVLITPFSNTRGYDYHDSRAIFITHHEIYGTEKILKKKKKKKLQPSLTVADLNIDDYVVHENHGIGVYKGLEEIEISGVKKDYLILEYRGTDKLYIPTDQMDLIQSYIGTGDKRPQLSKLGSNQWSKTKARAKKIVEEIAEDLVALYARRAKEKGFAFSKDDQWQKDFEDSFPYQETEGQIQAVEEIKADMESERPMDRLLCGDVGFGKTEVALRAAFKAVMDSKQVAILVPTTILAQQHYSNIKKRFKNFPVNVDVISRFRTKGQQDQVLRSTRAGEVDILVGTHRILSQDVNFKDLGLLIIDEEQRFGVKDKEKIKLMKENVDVLTLSATPIPRTLQMGMIGIRDMSLLDEAPEERHPTSVYVLEYEASVIRDAIIREMSRDGQVYFVYNRVNDMEKIVSHLRDLVPEASIAVAHGQMNEKVLEQIMSDFNEGLYDVLVSTSIIETGMDIHNVNTMIIYNADYLGLSQLYQLKGRVGRSSRSSYAYFTYEAGKSLTEISEKRLKAIKDFGEFGSGLKIAMRDLELRGAGNILGESQSGHIDSIGYDLYMKFLEEAINKNKEGYQGPLNEVSIDLNIDSYIPSNYIKTSQDKIELYKKIAEISTKDKYYDIIDELVDRFGDPPKPVQNITKISLVKNLSSRLGFTAITGNMDKITFAYESRDTYDLEDIEKLSETFDRALDFNLSKNPSFSLRPVNFDHVYEFLETIKEIQGQKQVNNLHGT